MKWKKERIVLFLREHSTLKQSIPLTVNERLKREKQRHSLRDVAMFAVIVCLYIIASIISK